MGSYMNFKKFGNTVQPDGSGVTPVGNYPLDRQSSVYSLTFDEFQNTLAGPGKDLGSMNMEDLLKSIWTAEETQVMSSCPGGGDGMAPGGNLQRQGSLTLPRTLSQKTVDEVWRDVLQETVGAKDGSAGGGSNLEARQRTLGEMTLEEFLVRAGVVREDIQPSWPANNNGIYDGLPLASGFNNGSTIGFQQPPRNQGVLGNQLAGNNNVVHNLRALEKNMGGVISLDQQRRQPQPLFPKQTTFSSPMQLGNYGKLASPGVKGPVAGISNPLNNTLVRGGAVVMGASGNGGSTVSGRSPGKGPVAGISNPLNNTLVQGGAVVMGASGNGGSTVSGRSPGNLLASDTIAKSDVDTSSLSPSPRAFREGGRGRRSYSSLEKVVERRRKRMMKNRESAARSRARKQAYTLELEAEVAKLREMNQVIRKKQAEYMEMQKNQISETTNMPWVGKRICLRRTLTGPW